jgi:DNA polymerase delta subunit 4
MPSTRRTSGPRSVATGKQGTLSFNNRVTKSVPKSVKDTATTPVKGSPLRKHVSPPQDDVVPIDTSAIEVEETDEINEERPAPKKSEVELCAEKISDKQVDQYWRKLEKERMSKRVHQEDLSLAEKILRYFDVSSQYGVSTIVPDALLLQVG